MNKISRFLLPLLISIIAIAWCYRIQNVRAQQIESYESFIIKLSQPPIDNPEALVDDQIALARLLEQLKSNGDVKSYQIHYGQKPIFITASKNIRELLKELPNVQYVSDLTSSELDAFNSLQADDQPSSTEADTGEISGWVKREDTSAFLPNITVQSWYYSPTGLTYKTTTTQTDGTYHFTGLRLTTHRLYFKDPLENFLDEYLNNAYTFQDAQQIVLSYANPVATDKNISLSPTATVNGRVVNSNGNGISSIFITAWKFDGIDEWNLVGSTGGNTSGYYTMKGIPAGLLRFGYVDLRSPKVYVTEYFNNKDMIELADDFNAVLGATTTIPDVVMGGYGSITGAVTGQGGTPSISNIQVDVWGEVLTQWTQEISGTTTTASNGTYTSSFLGTRDYRLRFTDPYGMYLTEYFNNATTLDNATEVHVELGSPTPGKNIELALNPNAPITQNFGTGWYLVGWPVTPANTAPSSVFAPIAGTLDIAWDYDQCGSTDWTFYNPDISGNTLTAIAPSEGYWVKHTGSASLTVQGQYSASTSINLCTGWNLIGYPAARPKSVTEVLAPINGKYTLVYGYDGSNPADPWEKYDPAAPVGNDLTTFKPGRAYWINMNQDATLVIPGR